MKLCRECNVEKPLSDFYAHAKMKDGHLNKCKICVKSRIEKYIQANPEKKKEWSRNYANSESGKERARKYKQTDKAKEAIKQSKQRYRKSYPARIRARSLVRHEVLNGRLIRPDLCSECNKTGRVEGHHDDYTKPLIVRWLCDSCHKLWHRKNKPIFE